MTADAEQLAAILVELIAILQLQGRELERLITRVEQVTDHLPEANELSVVQLGLSALSVRIKEYRARRVDSAWGIGKDSARLISGSVPGRRADDHGPRSQVMPITPGWQDIEPRLVRRVLAGTFIGIDRSEHGRHAGLRTTRCYKAYREGKPIPSLIPTSPTAEVA